jgi:protoporphyrinogen oxidase
VTDQPELARGETPDRRSTVSPRHGACESDRAKAGEIVVVGAGPAGLAAAQELTRHGRRPIVLEQRHAVGGLARTETYKGYRFDIGGHRFLTKVPEIDTIWREILGPELMRVRRLSRIYYDGRFFDYPLNVPNLLRTIRPIEGIQMLCSYGRARVRPFPTEETFEHWVTNRFGARLYETFFKAYTEKVWGVPCDQLRADWAAQRIKGLSFGSVVRNALYDNGRVKSLANEFLYPRLGPGQMWERVAGSVQAAGGAVHLNTAITSVLTSGTRIAAVTARCDGASWEIPVDALLTSMPITKLIAMLDPPTPAAILEAGRGLLYRDFLIVNLIVRGAHLFPDNWIYVHSPEVKVGRIQNFKNWSAAMVPDPSRTSLGMEYFCSVGDALWERTDHDLVELAAKEIASLGLARSADVEDSYVIRERRAYPVYDGDYRRHLDVIQAYLAGFENLQTVGRNGMHRYNNQDHAMLTGILAARNVLGAHHDLWLVNTERSYYEEQQLGQTG